MTRWLGVFEKLIALLVCLPGIVVAVRFIRWYWEQNKDDEEPENV
jgi:uncharacterized iron-regulated membrane protein